MRREESVSRSIDRSKDWLINRWIDRLSVKREAGLNAVKSPAVTFRRPLQDIATNRSNSEGRKEGREAESRMLEGIRRSGGSDCL